MGGLLRYLDPTGRISVGGYWRARLVITVLTTLLGTAVVMVFQGPMAAILTGVVLTLLSLPFQTVLDVRRLHDRDRSGWTLVGYFFAPLFLVAAGTMAFQDAPLPATALLIAGVLVWFWCGHEVAVARGTPGPNRYGPEPTRR